MLGDVPRHEPPSGAERRDTPGRLIGKDAHDIYRLLAATPTDDVLAGRLAELRDDELAAPATVVALGHLQELFLAPDHLGAIMAGRAEELVGDPKVVAASTAALPAGLLESLEVL